MLFGLFYGDWTVLIVLPALFFSLFAQSRVKSAFSAYSRVASLSGLTAEEAARRLLTGSGITDVRIERVRGNLTDHYDPSKKVLRLSESVYGSRSVAAIGVACHEAGHAIQHANRYAFLSLRLAIIPVCRIGSNLAMPLFFIGLLFAGLSGIGDAFMTAGILCFSLATLFQLITLPVEFNASRRAIKALGESGILARSELPGAKRVLSAAALTYVAALASSLLSLLRLILIARGTNRRR